ncbi:alpha/beta hydrolase [Rhodovarius crocodyli]|uniref:Alpha/beta hydrolase n=1 Tax=Rhodovarius crocodyli TaxID=1979269 RepID=A0A437MPD4_9PROT|nr:alpha/beta hydrolase [Rhodovarius crocodyli]RVT99500.1 alpha/beta hydrolase [Rhodovarius crocodyli]
MEDARWQYMEGQMRPGFPALFQAFAAESAAVQGQFDIAYGAHPRMVFDGFRAPGSRALLAWFHAGYWQSRDKAQFRFIVPGLLAAGYDVALVNYPLCPDVAMPELLAATRAAIPAVLRWGGRDRLVAAGHSAGGHIVTELAIAGVEGVASVAAFSGIYDMVPLVGIPLNDNLRLTEETARAHSPLHRVRPGLPPALFGVGAAETPAFLRQNRAMAEAWTAAGNDARVHEEAGADHFTLLRALPAMLAG